MEIGGCAGKSALLLSLRGAFIGIVGCCWLGFRLRFRLRVCFRFRRFLRGLGGAITRTFTGRFRRCAFAGVISHIPSASLELDCGRGDLAFSTASTFRTLLFFRRRNALYLFIAISALRALVFVERQLKDSSHFANIRYESQACATRRSTGILASRRTCSTTFSRSREAS